MMNSTSASSCTFFSGSGTPTETLDFSSTTFSHPDISGGCFPFYNLVVFLVCLWLHLVLKLNFFCLKNDFQDQNQFLNMSLGSWQTQFYNIVKIFIHKNFASLLRVVYYSHFNCKEKRVYT